MTRVVVIRNLRRIVWAGLHSRTAAPSAAAAGRLDRSQLAVVLTAAWRCISHVWGSVWCLLVWCQHVGLSAFTHWRESIGAGKSE